MSVLRVIPIRSAISTCEICRRSLAARILVPRERAKRA